ncbi:MAG: cytochrome c oxidase assembly protein, partial [Candidatus Binatia bacterium]
PIEGGFRGGWNWRPDVLFVVIFLVTTYSTGWLWLRARYPRIAPWWRLGLYVSGLLALVIALVSPIEALAESRLSMHMVQHLLLLMIAPLFLLLANPLAVVLWGLPKRLRYAAGHLLGRRSFFRRLLLGATLMPVAWTLYVVDLWAWHHPALYQLALKNEWVHDLQHLLFFFTALLFWWPIVNPAPRLHGKISYGFRIVYLIAATLQNTLLGMVISLPDKVLYPFYTTVPQLRDLSPINDQALGGGIMWVSGHMYLIPIIFLVYGILKSEEEEISRGAPDRVPLRRYE